MTNEQLHLIRDALIGGHAGGLSADGQRKYRAALDILNHELTDDAARVDEAGRHPGCPMQHCEDMRLCGASRRCVMSKQASHGVKGPDHG